MQWQINAEYAFDEGFISRVKFGYRYAETTQDSDYSKGSSIGVDPTGILVNSAISDPSYKSEEKFFGGEASGFVTAEDGWRAFDFDTINAALVNTINIDNVKPSTGGELPILTPMGYIQRGGRQADGYIFNSSLDTSALYAMADFEYEFGSHMLTGNFGGRYIYSETEARAPIAGQGDINDLDELVVKDDYDHFLPSVNMAINLGEEEDLMLRFAYNKSIVRPDLRAASRTMSGNLEQLSTRVEFTLLHLCIHSNNV